MKKLFITLLLAGGFFICLVRPTFAADATISGTIKHIDGTPVVTMYLYVKDASTDTWVTGATSDANGNYDFDVAPGSYIFYNYNYTSTEPDVVFFIVTQQATVASGEIKTGMDFTLTRRARLSGHIYTSNGSTPIYNASISVSHVDGYAFGSGYDYSSIAGLYYTSPSRSGSDSTSATGLYDLSVIRTGYFGRKIEDINLAEDEHTYTQDVVMTGPSTVSGKITNESGAPLAGVAVTLRETDSGYNRTYSSLTDANGNYTISVYDVYDYNGTAVGSYSLSTSISGYISKSTSLTISANESTLANNNLILSQGGKIIGTVYESNGTTPLGSATVLVEDGYGNYYYATSASDGTYTVDALRPSSNYSISASKGNYVSKKSYNITVSANQTISGQNFALVAAKSFTGTVKSKSGAIIDGATVYLYSRGRVRSESADYSATSDSDGNFSFTTIVPGKYRVKVSKNGYFSYKSENFEIKNNISGQNYSLTTASSFYGRVTYKGEGVVGASIYAYSAKKDKDLGYSGTLTDNDGYYRIGNLQSGTYKIKIDSTEYAQKIVSKKVGEGQQLTVDVGLAQAGYISGYVFDKSTGLPLSGYPVKVKGSTILAYTDSNGYYIIDALAAGKYKIYVASTAYKTQYYGGTESPSKAKSIKVKAGQTVAGRNFYLVVK